jgi:hypothetical protein
MASSFIKAQSPAPRTSQPQQRLAPQLRSFAARLDIEFGNVICQPLCQLFEVSAGLVSRANSDHVDLILARPAICLLSGCKKDVDAGDKRGYDENDVCAPVHQVQFPDFCCTA